MVYPIQRLLLATPANHIDQLIDKLALQFDVQYLPEPSRHDAIAACREKVAIFVNPNKMTFRLDREFLQRCSNLRVIATASTGTNHIDMECAGELGIQVLSLTKRLDIIEKISGTAEHALALTLSIIRKVNQAAANVIDLNAWNYEPFIGRQIAGLTVGVIGYGRLGKMYSRFLDAMGANVLIFDPYVKQVDQGVQVSSLDEIASRADIIALHVHVSNETRGMISRDFLNSCKKQPFLINTSRADIVDESAVIDALKGNLLAGYGTDVLKDEFSDSIAQSPMIKAAKEGYNILITPHIGGMTREGQHMAYHATADALIEFFKPTKENLF